MTKIRHTLVSDGPTDANLIPIIDWSLKDVCGVSVSTGVRAEFHQLPTPPRTLDQKIIQALRLFPCDVLFVHRDAEREDPVNRISEITTACEQVPRELRVPTVAIVPVRMMEAWLCFNESAIRKAAGNPNGTKRLDLPPLREIESSPDPKRELKEALKIACERNGRRLQKFMASSEPFYQIVDYIDDFTPLRALPSFQRFEASILRMKNQNWGREFYG